jgi:hypothetical protein
MAVYYIKLGAKGTWAHKCFEHRILRLGYNEISHEEIMLGEDVLLQRAFRERVRQRNGEAIAEGTITNYIRQIRTFYNAQATDFWIALVGDRMYWCRAIPGVVPDDDGTKIRHAVDGWSDSDRQGHPLTSLRGSIRALSRFQGTICEVSGAKEAYVLRRIEGETMPEFVRAKRAFQELVSALEDIIKTMDWLDFEILVDLIFRESGFRRTSEVGGTQKTIDMDLTQPLTENRILVQVKSEAGAQDLLEFQHDLQDFAAYSRAYFVVHSPRGQLWQEPQDDRLHVLTAEGLARMALTHGLADWLIERSR